MFLQSSVKQVGCGHAVLEVKRAEAQAIVGRVDVREAVIHHAAERVLDGLLLESVFLGGLSRWGGLSDATVGDDYGIDC